MVTSDRFFKARVGPFTCLICHLDAIHSLSSHFIWHLPTFFTFKQWWRRPSSLGKWTFKFFLNNFPWIQRIQWIMIKSKKSMIAGYILHLTIDTSLDVVVKNDIPLLSAGWYLFRVVSGNRYIPRGSNENALCITSISNVFIASWVIPLVTILILDLAMIHWIQGNSFRKNSIETYLMMNLMVPTPLLPGQTPVKTLPSQFRLRPVKITMRPTNLLFVDLEIVDVVEHFTEVFLVPLMPAK